MDTLITFLNSLEDLSPKDFEELPTKLIKLGATPEIVSKVLSCYTYQHGWIFAGADFSSLEDYISALTTKDPNKLAVYEKGYCGHCLRAAYYFREELPHIDLDNPTSVNSIKKTHPELRQKSKSPTFLLTYGGKHYGLMSNCGFSESEAKKIEANYHELYKVSDSWVAERIAKASIDGYATVAFGLRVRTPLLAKSILGTSKTLKEAEAEGRTVGNSFGQSYGLLNNRAAIEFMQRVWASPYKYKIFLVSLIHDSIYLIMQDSIEVVEWVNTNLIQCMQWQDLPELKHPTVKLGANLDLYYPTWANPITLPNNATRSEIRTICKASLNQSL